MTASTDLSLPRHQWRQVKCAGYDLWFWVCTDCMTTRPMQEHPNEPEPVAGTCLGKGPHDSFHIALVREIFPQFGWQVPEHLREG